MTSSSITMIASAAGSATATAASIAVLKQQASTLQRQLVHVQKPGSTFADASKSSSISLQIVSVESQIEQLVLETQLSKLGARTSAASEASGAAPSKTKPSVSKNNGVSSPSSANAGPYRPAANPPGKYVNVEAY